ncbi:ESX secretion-associated protein EspG [Actinophytocola oryzae]|uniref:ESAT-6 protein secretion system EspG family protein n=1 Tax=Actinophytocola oryzae TaxID=502181 RepID=A0A4V3FQK7_9PSEU|nr:ESX secretion-associated protein EspG [Actinophytocola oryzae]TDV40051.1 ESAT-6 protein secretion system EspG family protein [Actinophytocola oryzae]
MAGFTLSLPAADVLAQTLEVNLRQFPFEIPYFGEYERDRRRIAAEVFVDLRRQGLVHGADIDPELVRALRTLSEYVITVGVMGTVEKTRKVYARAAAAGEHGVLAVMEGDTLRVEPIRPTALAVSLVGLLPALESAPGQSVTITLPGTADRPEADEIMAPVYRTQNSDQQQLRLAESYLSRPRTGTGLFTVSGRDRRTGLERQGGQVTWIDTDAGRYLAVVRPPGEDGRVRGTYSPADPARLTQQLGELIESIAPRR